MLIHIVNETGIDYQTKIYDQETGKEIEGITAITISPMTVNKKYITALLEISSFHLDVVAQARFATICPHCGERVQGIPKERED